MGKEDQPRLHRERGQPLQPTELPPDLAAFLRTQLYACVSETSDRGTILVIKAPGREIERISGDIPIKLSRQLFQHPSAPVIRLLTVLYDEPTAPLAFETFFNVADEQQRSEFAALGDQDEMVLLFFDEQLRHRRSKRLRLRDQETTRQILAQADRLRAAIPAGEYDFDRAKADVMTSTDLL